MTDQNPNPFLTSGETVDSTPTDTEVEFKSYLVAIAYGVFKKREVLPVTVAYPPLSQHGVFSFV